MKPCQIIFVIDADFEESNTVDIYRSIMRVRQRLQAASTAIAKKYDMSVSEMALLDTLGKYGPLTMGRLAELSFSSAANATYTVRGLEKRGLANRERSKESNRSVNVSLTPDGRKIFRNTYIGTVQSVNSLLAENLDAKQRTTLLELLDRFLGSEHDD